MKKDQHLFSYQANFAKMNPIALPSHHPFHQLPASWHPRQGLSHLMKNAIRHGYVEYREDIENPYVRYVTPWELKDLAYVEELLHRTYHVRLGAPLNRPEVSSIMLYTDRTDLCRDFRWAQMQGKYEKWRILDSYLMEAITKLHACETKPQQQYLYSGLSKVRFDTRVKFGFLATYTSTSKSKGVAEGFIQQGGSSEGMLMHIDKSMRAHFPHAHVSWQLEICIALLISK